MAQRGNRPDCAYFLLLGVALAAFFLALGGVCTYVAYWPEAALAHYHNTHHKVIHPHVSQEALDNEDRMELPQSMNFDQEQKWDEQDIAKQQQEQDKQYFQKAEQNTAMRVLGPLSLVVGSFVLILVAVYAVKYRCDYEPEEPNIAFLRLASELSLNFDPERNRYRLMRNYRQMQDYPLNGMQRPDGNDVSSTSSNRQKY